MTLFIIYFAQGGDIGPMLAVWVKSTDLTLCRRLPVCPDQRTSSDWPGWSVSCQQRTSGSEQSIRSYDRCFALGKQPLAWTVRYALAVLMRQLFDHMVILQQNGPMSVCRDRVLIIADGIAGGGRE
jgi:hypothetical protein